MHQVHSTIDEVGGRPYLTLLGVVGDDVKPK